MTTVREIWERIVPDRKFEKIYLIGGGFHDGARIRFTGVEAGGVDHVQQAKIVFGCPEIADRDAAAFLGIDKRFDDIYARLESTT